jgi:hypothetical protein
MARTQVDRCCTHALVALDDPRKLLLPLLPLLLSSVAWSASGQTCHSVDAANAVMLHAHAMPHTHAHPRDRLTMPGASGSTM